MKFGLSVLTFLVVLCKLLDLFLGGRLGQFLFADFVDQGLGMLLEEVEILKLEYFVVLFKNSFLLYIDEICQEYQVFRIFRVASVFFIGLLPGYLQNLPDVGHSFFPHLPLYSVFEDVSGIDEGVVTLADVDFHASLYFKQTSA